MPAFTCVDAATGEVLFSGTADDIEALESPGVVVVQGIAPDNCYRHQEAWVVIPVRPSTAHVWDWGSKTWSDPRTLADHKATRIRVLKIARDAHLNGGFWWDSSFFDSDLVSQMRLLGLKQKAQSDASMVEQWRLADNSWRELNASDALAVWDAFETHLRNSFIAFASLEAQVLAATTVEQVEGVTWS